MYTKNPVTGKNETLVNASMLKGAVDGVVSKIAGKADKGAIEELSVYTEGVRMTVANKADKADVDAVSVYAEGMLPKSVYTPLVDAYVGLVCKVADPDVLEGAAKMAFAADPVKYTTSNPDDDRCAEVTGDNYKTGNPIYDAVKAAGSTVELPPFLRLKIWGYYTNVSNSVAYWKTELPNLTDGSNMFEQTGLTSWKTELPNLTEGSWMFYQTVLTSWTVELPNLILGESMFRDTAIEEWTVELSNLTNGDSMFTNGSFYNPDTPAALKRFRGTLPALVNGRYMFTNCPLDIESIRCIAESINDVNSLTESFEVTKRLDICVGYDIDSEPLHEEYVETIKNKGWTVTVNDIQQ